MIIKSTIKDQRGASMLFVLAALIVVGFIGTALTKMSSSDQMGNALYSTSASARSAAKSGMISAIHRLENGDGSNLELLQDWVDLNINTPVIITSGIISDNQSFETSLLAFDIENFNITLQTHGIGKGGARATITSVVHLDGLDWATEYDWGNENAIFLGDGLSLNTHGALNIDGNVYVGTGANINFDANIHGSTFKKSFIVAKAADENASVVITAGIKPQVDITFEGPAYFGTKPFIDGNINLHFEDLSGFQYGAKMTGGGNHIGLMNNSYWSGNANIATSAGEVNGTSSPDPVLYHNGTYTAASNTNNATVTLGVTDASGAVNLNFEEELGIELDQCEFMVDPSVIPSSAIHHWTTGSAVFTEDSAETWWQGKELWNDFLVIQLDATMDLGDNGGTFDRKMIVLVNGEELKPATGSVFDCGPNANFTIINNNGGEVRNIGGWDYYRGYMWSGEGSRFLLGGAGVPVKNIDGAIHAVKGVHQVEWFPEPSTATINYVKEVIEELDHNGFITKTNCGDEDGTPSDQLIQTKARISVECISQTM